MQSRRVGSTFGSVLTAHVWFGASGNEIEEWQQSLCLKREVLGWHERFHFRAHVFVRLSEVKEFVFLGHFLNEPHTQASSVLASIFFFTLIFWY